MPGAIQRRPAPSSPDTPGATCSRWSACADPFYLAVPTRFQARLELTTQSRLCYVLRSARYPCQVSVSDSPPALSLAGTTDSTFCVGIPPVRFPGQASRFLAAEALRRGSGMHATPAGFRAADRPVLTLPGALTSTTRQVHTNRSWQPAPSSPALPGATNPRCSLRCTETSRFPDSSQACPECFTRSRHRGVAVVCTLPLPGFGLWQPAGSNAPRCAALRL